MNPLIKSVLLAKSIMRYPIVVVIRHCWKKKKNQLIRAFESCNRKVAKDIEWYVYYVLESTNRALKISQGWNIVNSIFFPFLNFFFFIIISFTARYTKIKISILRWYLASCDCRATIFFNYPGHLYSIATTRFRNLRSVITSRSNAFIIDCANSRNLIDLYYLRDGSNDCFNTN